MSVEQSVEQRNERPAAGIWLYGRFWLVAAEG